MDDPLSIRKDPDYEAAEKRVRKIKKFYKDVATWVATSVFLIALNIFLSGHISWAKYPVFFWGIALVFQLAQVVRWYRLDRSWEEKMIRKFITKNKQAEASSLPGPRDEQEDYSEELLSPEKQREKEIADLSEYRKLKKPWKDEDLV